MIGNACINAPYKMKDRQPKVFSQRNLRSLFTSREMASKMDAIYPSSAPMVSIMIGFPGYFLFPELSPVLEMTGAAIGAAIFSEAAF